MALPAVASLLTSELDEALLLASLGAVDLDPDRWRRETLARIADPHEGGVLIARDRAARVCGLLDFRVMREGAGEPSLSVERLVAFDLMNPRSVANDLIAEAIRRARLKDCLTLTLIRPLDAPSTTAALVLASGVADLHSVF
ncbi:MAG: hypothetical protein IOB84_08095 [Brevundimonas sp.]|nr:hypothetical protein [Brevundimonas sp.]